MLLHLICYNNMDVWFSILLVLSSVAFAVLQEPIDCNNVLDHVSQLKVENTQFLMAHERQITERKIRIREMEDDIFRLTNVLEAQMNSTANSVSDMESRVSTTKEMRNTFIGFAVYSDVDSLYMDRDDRMIFNNVAFNSGNGYDANTGEFTVSVAGWYFFSVSIFSKDHHDSLQLMKNGERYPGAYGDTRKHDQGSVSWLLECNAGDKVYVQQYHQTGGACWRGNTDDDQLNAFSGYLILSKISFKSTN